MQSTACRVGDAIPYGSRLSVIGRSSSVCPLNCRRSFILLPNTALAANLTISLRKSPVRLLCRRNQARPYSDASTTRDQREPRHSSAVGTKLSTRNDRSQEGKSVRSSSSSRFINDDPEDALHGGRQPRSGFNVRQEGRTLTVPQRSRDDWRDYERPQWQIQKSALKLKLNDAAWNPRKRLSPDALEGIRELHKQYPDKYTTPVLAEQFEVSPEAIRRILKSKWKPSEEEEVDRRKRWDKRGESIWSRWVDMGLKPPKKWREMGIGRALGDRISDVEKVTTFDTPKGSLDHGEGKQAWVRKRNAQNAVHVPVSEKLL